MKLDREREREILHSLEILMDSYAKIDVSRSDDNCLHGETQDEEMDCNGTLFITSTLCKNSYEYYKDSYTRYYGGRFLFFLSLFPSFCKFYGCEVMLTDYMRDI